MSKSMKAYGLAVTAVAAMFMFGANGSAYIDPSVVTYIIQAVAGIVIAIGAVVGIYWRKAKRKINDTLGVDENRSKEVESDEIIINSEIESAEEISGEAESADADE